MESKHDGKYNKILNAAIDVISEKGLDKTSISDIVKRLVLHKVLFTYTSLQKRL